MEYFYEQSYDGNEEAVDETLFPDLMTDESAYLYEERTSSKNKGSKIIKEQDSALNQPILLEYLDLIWKTKYSNYRLRDKNLAYCGWRIIRERGVAKQSHPTNKEDLHKKVFSQLVSTCCPWSRLYQYIGSYVTKNQTASVDLGSTLHEMIKISSSLVMGEDPDKYYRRLNKLCENRDFTHYSGGLDFWTMIVNCLNTSENSTVDKIISVKRNIILSLKMDHPCVSVSRIRIPDHKLTIYVGEGWIYWPELNLLLDQPMALMIKDIFLARRNSMLFIGTSNETHEDPCIRNLLSVYEEGDDLISRYGNSSYNLLKLLEPLCNSRLIDLAHSDKLPLINSFKVYIDDELDKIKTDTGMEINKITDIIAKSSNVHFIVNIFGCFRHWGHPYIEWEEGLSKLHEQVQSEKQVESDFVDRLASRLAKKLLNHYFNKNRIWPIDPENLAEGHPLKKHVIGQTWPGDSDITLFGDNWHLLPFTQLFPIPASIPLSVLADDKSHSLTRSELKKALAKGNIGEIENRRVVLSLLKREELNLKEFLKNIDDHGLDKEYLVIGLKEKERELKIIGRFFSLMSFNLRIYFVLTEKMIAEHILPLFDALTMTDNLNKVFKKMINRVPGHGPGFPASLTFSNHLDYEKWNNHQREASTKSVFAVIDKAFGYKNLVSRTHEFFEKSLIYHASSPHLFKIDEDLQGVNLSDLRVCWNGQKGGLEGLRQKGWSLISLLMIEEIASQETNTDVRVLAQGDNQVICLTYKPNCRPEDPVWEPVSQSILRSLDNFLTKIRDGASKLGLIIKDEETWTSYNYMIYGKIPLFRRMLLNPGSKKWSRNGCLNNDLLPTMKNIMSSSSTTALTNTQHSESYVHSVWLHLLLSWEIVSELLVYTPLIELSPLAELKDKLKVPITPHSLEMLKLKLLLIDPSLGGVGGTNIARFFIRQFPDSITEGLSFWKAVYHRTSNLKIKELALTAGNPSLSRPSIKRYKQLIDSPDSLNLSRVAEAASLLKMKIGEELRRKSGEVKNKIVKEALELTENGKEEFIDYLSSSRPLFPRFISEVYDASIYGYKESVLGLFQSSRTIRVLFKSSFTSQLRRMIFRSETLNLKRLIEQHPLSRIWDCSSEKADQLRSQSWGTTVVGSTVPHPLEYIGDIVENGLPGISCRLDLRSINSKEPGPGWPYLGSATASDTSVYKSYETKTEYSILRKPIRLQKTINWFVDYDSNMWRLLCKNLTCFADVQPESVFRKCPRRSGSALHRFACSRYSNGGYCSTSHNLPSYLYLSTDSLPETYRTDNYDFMFQATLLMCQFKATEKIYAGASLSESITFKFDTSCCMRTIDEIVISSREKLPSLMKLSRFGVTYLEDLSNPVSEPPTVNLPRTNQYRLTPRNLSYSAGLIQSFLSGVQNFGLIRGDDGSNLFPVSIYNKLVPYYYLKGLSYGNLLANLLESVKYEANRPLPQRREQIRGHMIRSCYKLSSGSQFSEMSYNSPLMIYLIKKSCVPTPSYPMKVTESQDLLRTYLINEYSRLDFRDVHNDLLKDELVVFSELQDCRLFGAFIISVDLMFQLHDNPRGSLEQVRELRRRLSDYLMLDPNCDLNFPLSSKMSLMLIDQELRHACKDLPSAPRTRVVADVAYSEYEGDIRVMDIDLTMTDLTQRLSDLPLDPPETRIRFPLQSALRLIKFMTGTHYKVKCILREMPHLKTYWVLGDGSGGVTSLLLRKYPHAKVCFNSLLQVASLNTSGNSPPPPSAVLALPVSCQQRCLNLHSHWRDSTDVTKHQTWIDLNSYVRPDCIISECQFESVNLEFAASLQLGRYLLENPDVRFILWKTYLHRLTKGSLSVCNILGRHFKCLRAIQTEFTSFCSEEVYIFGFKRKPYLADMSVQISEFGKCKLEHFCFSTSEINSEISRALNVNLDNTLTGFKPAWIQFMKNSTAQNLLNTLGTSYEWRSTIIHHLLSEAHSASSILTFSELMWVISTHSVLNVRSGVLKNTSLQKISDHFSITLGHLILGGYLNRDITWLEECYQIVTSQNWFGFQPRERGYSLSYSPYGSPRCNQRLPLRLNLELMTSWINLMLCVNISQRRPATGLDDITTSVSLFSRLNFKSRFPLKMFFLEYIHYPPCLIDYLNRVLRSWDGP